MVAPKMERGLSQLIVGFGPNWSSNYPTAVCPGFDGFLTEQGETWATKAERRALIEAHWAKIYAYPYWREVLDQLEVEPTVDAATEIIARAGRTGGGGEGPDHLALKELVRSNPHRVGLAIGDDSGEAEYCLPSGDSVDVVFRQKRRIHAVEVKPAGAAEADIARGLFQCVKYRAVLEALAGYEHDHRKLTACLALGGTLPDRLIPLRNSLNVDVFDNLGRE